MKNLAALAIISLVACHRHAVTVSSIDGGPSDAGIEAGHKFAAAAAGRQINIVAGSGISATAAENAQHQEEWTVTNTSPGGGGVTSVTASGAGISASPTTGSVVISNTGVTSLTAGTNITLSGSTGNVTVNSTAGGGGVTSVTGSTGISVSPTTGAAVVTLQTPVTSGNGGTGLSSPAAHSIPFTEGAGNFALLASFTANHPLLAQGGGVDPNWAGYALAAPGTSGNVLTSNGTDWTSAPPAPATSSLLSQQGGSGVGVVTGSFSTILTNSPVAIAVSGQKILVYAGIECGAGTIGITQSYDYQIDVDGTGVSTQQNIGTFMNNGTETVGGSAFYIASGLSVANHSITLVARKHINSGTDSCLGSMITQVVAN